MPVVLRTEIVDRVPPSDLGVRQVEAEFRRLVASGVEIRCVGEASRNPSKLLSLGYTPKHKLQLFDATFYLTNLRYDENFRFFVAYVVLEEGRSSRSRSPVIHPRIFYKDSSLVWRSPTHYIRSDEDNWIGKGDLKCVLVDGEETEHSAEETTNLPLEIQSTLDAISRRGGRARRDDRAVGRILRRAPDGRFEPYRDFIAPRRRAMSDRRNRINDGEHIARFLRENDPGSLRFVPGFEPDFGKGVVEVSFSGSRLYGGEVRKFRILSTNRAIQYQFIASPGHAWIIPPQALTTEIMSYGVRTVDVEAPEDLFVPGYEYHFIDPTEDPPHLYSQIPEGFAGAASEVDPSRADASPWIEALPVIQEFRRKIPLPW